MRPSSIALPSASPKNFPGASEPSGLTSTPISWSRPASMSSVACAAPQSDMTQPSKSHCSRRIEVNRVSLLQAKVPLTFG